ncbi:MAG TPA: carboxy terminal-processing peptidase [Flavobacteriaceae bacterium]|nr:carboxy terminal-processing peptidase [Flavobacteriaceae bacterium]
MKFNRLMKRNYKVMLLALLLAFASCSFTTKSFDEPENDKLLVQVITYLLQQVHFDPKDIDDEFSTHVFKAYLEQVDPYKRYFYKSDIEEFRKFETELDDQLKNYDVSFFSLTHEKLIKRIEESKSIYQEILSKPFDFTIDEEFNADYENIDYVNTKKDIKERWRKQLKLWTISNYNDLLDEQNSNIKSDSAYVVKSNSEIEKEAREATLKLIDRYYKDGLEKLERKDWFSRYINAIVEEFDPHTNYYAPEDRDAFDQEISGKLEGIGARLSSQLDNIKIVELISGGPAWRGQELEVGDIILKVKQEDEEEPISLVGMRTDDAVKYIKGPKGTKVTLTVKKVDGTIKDIEIVRDVVEIEETYARSSIVKKADKNFGVIYLPKFYADFDDYKNRNAASDIKEEIERLKEQGMEGLVLDLRDNGGGSLQAVIDMAGLFIKDGPIVQVRATGEPKEVLKDRDKSIVWDGPLVILVNELSASASEIMAAAMQDYKRAIIIGGKQTYGKGTVQQVMDLNRMVRNNTSGDLGALKLTTQKYYRINGGSVQLEGVKSDVVVPDRWSFIPVGEKDWENPLPWDEIDPANYKVWDSYFDYETTITKSKERMSNNEQLNLIEEYAMWVKNNMDIKSYSLNFEEYKSKLDKNEVEIKKFDVISDYKTNLTFESLPYEKNLFIQDSVLKIKRERWHESLSQDVYIEEALNVLEDLKMSYSINKVAVVKD